MLKTLEMRCCLRCCLTAYVTLATCSCFNDLKFRFALAVSPATFVTCVDMGQHTQNIAVVARFPQYTCCTGKVIEHATEKNGTVRSVT